jgi:hypothetical protein
MYFSASAVFNSRQSAIGVFIIKNKINIYKWKLIISKFIIDIFDIKLTNFICWI